MQAVLVSRLSLSRRSLTDSKTDQDH